MFMRDDGLTGYVKDYSKALRAIGDGLEALQAELIEIRCERGNYIVRARTRNELSKISLLNDLRNGAFRIMWHILPSSYRWTESSDSSDSMELSYTPGVIDRLECAGRARREGAGVPDPYSVPTALRVIGAYIDSKNACLRQISRRDESIVIEYEIPPGDCHTEELTPEALHALFTEMYAKRGNRDSDTGKEIETHQNESQDDSR